MSCDLALINAKVQTINSRKTIVEAVAIKGDRIIKVGTNREISKLITEKTQVLTLQGKTVVPGLIDTHIHLADFGRCLLWLDLTNVDSIHELQRLLKAKAEQTPCGRWIIGRGWNENRFKENRMPTYLDLDEAAPDNPVILYHGAAMICVANSKALDLAGVTKQTSTPEGGFIDKTPGTCELSGIFKDTATNLIWQAVPEPSVDELSEASTFACQKIAEAGLTSVHWILISPSELQLVKRLQESGMLSIRVNIVVPFEFLKDAVALKLTGTPMLHLAGVFLAADGYLDSKTAALTQPYSDEPANSGKMLLTEKELAASVDAIAELGFQPIIHAMGDRAIDLALKAIEQTKGSVRFRMEQAAVLNQALISRLRAREVIISVQPTVIATEFAVWSATARLGLERATWLHPIKTLIETGVKVAGGSDCPMEPLNPMLGMQEAVERKSFPEQRLTAEEALRMYTVDAAYCSGEENLKGSIEEGKLADLTVLSDDPLTVASQKIKEIEVVYTIVNGKLIYRNPKTNI